MLIELPQDHGGKSSAPLLSKLDRAGEIGASSISGAAGGALIGSAFGGLVGGTVGAVVGFVVNAAISWIRPTT